MIRLQVRHLRFVLTSLSQCASPAERFVRFCYLIDQLAWWTSILLMNSDSFLIRILKPWRSISTTCSAAIWRWFPESWICCRTHGESSRIEVFWNQESLTLWHLWILINYVASVICIVTMNSTSLICACDLVLDICQFHTEVSQIFTPFKNVQIIASHFYQASV